jgi:hypothetical protein
LPYTKALVEALAYTLPVIATEQLNWRVVEDVARDLALGPTLYYYLALCEELVPGGGP